MHVYGTQQRVGRSDTDMHIGRTDGIRRALRQADEPLLEPGSYRLWDGRGLSAEERVAAKKITLGAGAGERVHEIVVLDAGGGCIVKVLSKERIKDERINVLFRVEEPGDKVSILPCKRWKSRSDYEQVIGVLKNIVREDRVAVIPGEDIHGGLAEVLGRPRKQHGAETKEEPEGSSADPGTGAIEEQGGDSHGG